MRVPLRWLLRHVCVDAPPEQIVERLHTCSLERCGLEGSSARPGDVVLETGATVNRVDLRCVHGIAREVFALFDGARLVPGPASPIVPPRLPNARVPDVGESHGQTAIADQYRGPAAGPSPAWLGDLLRAAGQAPADLLQDAAFFAALSFGGFIEVVEASEPDWRIVTSGVDADGVRSTADLLAALLVSDGPFVFVARAERPGPDPARVIRLRPSAVDEILGTHTDPDANRGILTRLGFVVMSDWTVHVPSWRATDVSREIDLVREVSRFHIASVPSRLPERPGGATRPPHAWAERRQIQDLLVACGLDEVYTHAIVRTDPHPGALALRDAKRSLRTTLLPSLIGVIRRNAVLHARDGERGGVFEIAHVYLPTTAQCPDEREVLAGVMPGPFRVVKGLVDELHDALGATLAPRPGRGAPFLDGRAAETDSGVFGELDLGQEKGTWSAFEFDLDLLVSTIAERPAVSPAPRFPAIHEHVVVNVPADVLAIDVKAAAERVAETATPVDARWAETGEKTIVLSVRFRDPHRTLTAADAAALRRRLADVLHEDVGGRLV